MPITTLSSKERSLVVAAVAFANLSPVQSNRQVEDLFGIEAGRIAVDSPLYVDETQPMLRRWLRQTVGGNGGRAQTSLEIANHRMLANYEQSPERMRQWREAA